jgi:hypothetical protein
LVGNQHQRCWQYLAAESNDAHHIFDVANLHKVGLSESHTSSITGPSNPDSELRSHQPSGESTQQSWGCCADGCHSPPSGRLLDTLTLKEWERLEPIPVGKCSADDAAAALSHGDRWCQNTLSIHTTVVVDSVSGLHLSSARLLHHRRTAPFGGPTTNTVTDPATDCNPPTLRLAKQHMVGLRHTHIMSRWPPDWPVSAAIGGVPIGLVSQGVDACADPCRGVHGGVGTRMFIGFHDGRARAYRFVFAPIPF